MTYPNPLKRLQKYRLNFDVLASSIEADRPKVLLSDPLASMPGSAFETVAYGRQQAALQIVRIAEVPEEFSGAIMDEVDRYPGCMHELYGDILPGNKTLIRWISAHWARHGRTHGGPGTRETYKQAEGRIRASLSRKYGNDRWNLVSMYKRCEREVLSSSGGASHVNLAGDAEPVKQKSEPPARKAGLKQMTSGLF